MIFSHVSLYPAVDETSNCNVRPASDQESQPPKTVPSLSENWPQSLAHFELKVRCSHRNVLASTWPVFPLCAEVWPHYSEFSPSQETEVQLEVYRSHNWQVWGWVELRSWLVTRLQIMWPKMILPSVLASFLEKLSLSVSPQQVQTHIFSSLANLNRKRTSFPPKAPANLQVDPHWTHAGDVSVVKPSP